MNYTIAYIDPEYYTTHLLKDTSIMQAQTLTNNSVCKAIIHEDIELNDKNLKTIKRKLRNIASRPTFYVFYMGDNNVIEHVNDWHLPTSICELLIY